jgi:hypothetical protein
MISVFIREDPKAFLQRILQDNNIIPSVSVLFHTENICVYYPAGPFRKIPNGSSWTAWLICVTDVITIADHYGFCHRYGQLYRLCEAFYQLLRDFRSFRGFF